MIPAPRPTLARTYTLAHAHAPSASAGARIGSLAACLLALAIALGAPTALAQHAGDPGVAPPPPPGPGELTVQVVSDEPGADLEGLAIALYALAPDGTPGLTDGVTDADGRLVFSGISNDPSIVYLVGARYAEIPFGERIAFDPDVTQARIEIRVSSPTQETAGVQLDEVRARIDWMGDRLAVTEILRLRHDGTRVIQLPAEDRSRAIAVRRLPATAKDFAVGPSSIGDGLALEDGQVRFWGPLYPGEQRIEYRYSLPIERTQRGAGVASASKIELPIELREAAGRLVVVAGTPGLEVAGADLVPSREVSSDSGQKLASWARGPIAAGRALRLSVTLPESRLDATALSIPRADTWLELDDTWLSGNVELQMVVAPGAPIAGTPDAPLLHVSLPTGASLRGVAPEAEAFGLIPTEDGGFDVVGPIGPGEHALGYAYRMPSGTRGARLDMRFPRDVSTLNVLIADNGLALSSSRLHRRRPFRNGTRNYLHREAFNIGADEVVDLELKPLSGAGLPQQASVALVVAGAAAAGLFLMAPLRRASRGEVAEDPAHIALRDEREAVYTAIADLDHDFETGKLDEADYHEMRDALRARAIELLRQERGEGPAPESLDAPDPAAAAPTAQPATLSSTAPTPPSARSTANSLGALAAQRGETEASTSGGQRFCTECGGKVEARWRFCSHCGGALHSDAAQDARG